MAPTLVAGLLLSVVPLAVVGTIVWRVLALPRVPAMACTVCGYDLAGLRGQGSGRCPECGSPRLPRRPTVVP